MKGYIAQITRFIPSPVSHNHNELLIKPISLIEVEETVFHMIEGKALGPYGFTVKFFHNF